MNENKRFTIAKTNLILIAIAFVIIVVGFIVMSGVKTGNEYNPDIFSVRHIVIGPMISFAGFIFMIFAILFKPKKS